MRFRRLVLTALLALGCADPDAPSEAGHDDSGEAGLPRPAEGNEEDDASVARDAGAPRPLLDDLRITGIAAPPRPAFDPGTTRYSVRGDGDERVLTLTPVADPELDVFVDGMATDSGEAVALPDAEAGSQVEVEVMNDDGDARGYTVEYLPSDFPVFEVTVREPEASDDPLYLTPTDGSVRFIVKLNEDGVPLFYRQASGAAYDFKKHPGGEISYALRIGPRTNCEHIVMDETFTEIERVTTSGLDHTDLHEFLILDNGNYVVQAYESADRDLSEFGGEVDGSVLDGILQELSPEREVLFQWSSWDHMVYSESRYRNPADYAHLNSVFIDSDGDWLVSSRGMSQILKIDRDTGDVLWRLGGIQNDFEFLDDPHGYPCGQHTATRLENGNLLIFDNGQYCAPEVEGRGNHTRVVEYEIDEEALTARLVWSYHRAGAFTRSQGSAQRLDNGNTLIGWGFGPPMMVTEVAPDGEVVFELQAQMPDGDEVTSYRAWRIAD